MEICVLNIDCFWHLTILLYRRKSGAILIKNFMAPFYGWGFKSLKIIKPLQRESLLFTTNSPGVAATPRKDGRLSQPWSHSMVLNLGPLNWESSALTNKPLLHNWWKLIGFCQIRFEIVDIRTHFDFSSRFWFTWPHSILL